MLVRTYVAKSKIHGLGLFARDSIRRGTPMQMDNPVFDIILTQAQVNTLFPIARQYIYRYAWTDSYGLMHIGVDNDKYCNHTEDPNMGLPKGEGSEICVALRDIKADEEITEGYRLFPNAPQGF